MIGKQLVSNREAISTQLVSNIDTDKQAIDVRLASNKGANKVADGKQLVSETIGLQQLSPLQQQLLSFLFEETKKTRSRTTDPISSSTLAEALNTTKNTLKDLIAKLKKRSVFISVHSKRGVGGWTIFELSDSIYHSLLDAEKRGKLSSIGMQLVCNKGVNKIATRSSSSSSLNIEENLKLTTTERSPNSDLPPDWQEIDFSELIESGIHFGRPQLKQWFDRKYCTAQQAQESIWHFAFHLKHSKPESFRTGPLNFFMGVMAKSKYFPRPDGYLSPEEEAMQLRLEGERKASERRRQVQDEFFELTFEKWFDSMTGSEINALTPEFKGLEAKKSVMRDRFRNEFYLTIRDNPSVDVRTLKLEAPTQKALAVEPKLMPAMLPQSVADPLDTFRKVVVQLSEEIRQLEAVIQQEPRESMKAELRKGLTVALKKRQQILDSNPTIAEECRLIEEAFAALPGSTT